MLNADPGAMPIEVVRETVGKLRTELVRLNQQREAFAFAMMMGRGIMAIDAAGFGFCAWVATLPSDNLTLAICAVSCAGMLAHGVSVFRRFELPMWRYRMKVRGYEKRVGVFLAELNRRGVE